MSLEDLPTLNAALNSVATLLLVAGFVFIRQKKVTAHKACMISAAIVSILFLVSYVTYHSQVGFTKYTGEGLIRMVYFAILIPHTILASVAVPPLAILTLYFALRGRFEKHKKIARWTLPIWLFVSVTGVLVYLILYQL